MKTIRLGYVLLAATLIGGSVASAEQEPARDCRSAQPPKRLAWEVQTNDIENDLEYIKRGLGYLVFSDEVGFTTVTLNLENVTHQRLEARAIIFCQPYLDPAWFRVIQLTEAGQASLTVPLLESKPVLIDEGYLDSTWYHRARAAGAYRQGTLHPDLLGFYREMQESGATILRDPTWVGFQSYLWFAYLDNKGRIVPVYGKNSKLWLQKKCEEKPSPYCFEGLFDE